MVALGVEPRGQSRLSEGIEDETNEKEEMVLFYQSF